MLSERSTKGEVLYDSISTTFGKGLNYRNISLIGGCQGLGTGGRDVRELSGVMEMSCSLTIWYGQHDYTLAQTIPQKG